MRWVMYWADKALGNLKGWRTVIVNTIASVLPILEMTEVYNVIPQSLLPWYALFIALINVYMRGITTTPLGESK